MMWHFIGMNGGNWFWMAPIMVLFWGGLVALVLLAFRGRRSDGDQAMVALRQRLASGQINQDEYEKTSRLLKS